MRPTAQTSLITPELYLASVTLTKLEFVISCYIMGDEQPFCLFDMIRYLIGQVFILFFLIFLSFFPDYFNL